MRAEAGVRAFALGLAVALSAPPVLAARHGGAAQPAAQASSRPVARAASSRPDAALYHDAQAAEAALRAQAKRAARHGEWEAVVLRYRKVIARYPRSGYCDNALQAIGNLYRDMAKRFQSDTYAEDAVAAYRSIVDEYPSSSLGDDALWAALQMAQQQHDRREVSEIAREYLDTCPDGRRAREVKKLLRQREPAAPLPSPPPPGLAGVFDLKSWSGDSSTRVVVELERKVPIQSDLAKNPDRLWIDLIGARLHPNLARRVFPVGDGLLEQVRIGKNREDVVRIVLDFKDVWEHQVFYLEDPTRLVIDVRGQSPAASAGAAPPTASSQPSSPSVQASTQPSAPPQSRAPAARPASAAAVPPAPLPARRVNGMVPSEGAGRSPAAPIELGGEAPEPRRAGAEAAPEPPATNRAGSYSLARQLGLSARRIVIDAGHGGHDPGTIGHGGLQEKELVLDVALRLARLVRQELATDVVMTRDSDVFIPLEERTAIANSRGADLFLSIHANSSRNAQARGIETYFLNFARNSHAEAVAARENAISPATLKDLQTLVKAITLNSKIAESRDFAAAVQEAMVAGAKTRQAALDRGVHTAPFYVLIGANMPAVLAEIAFVSNPEDEKQLRTPEYRETIARSLLRGVRSYLEALNRAQPRQLTDAGTRSTVAQGHALR